MPINFMRAASGVPHLVKNDFVEKLPPAIRRPFTQVAAEDPLLVSRTIPKDEDWEQERSPTYAPEELRKPASTHRRSYIGRC